MVYASAELAAAYTSAGAGAKHPPKDARAVAQQVAVLQARRAALILNDPLKDKVCRRSGWLAQRFAGGGACSTCHDQAKNPRSAFDCRVCHRHGPDKLDWAYEHFPAGCTVEFGKPEQRAPGASVASQSGGGMPGQCGWRGEPVSSTARLSKQARSVCACCEEWINQKTGTPAPVSVLIVMPVVMLVWCASTPGRAR